MVVVGGGGGGLQKEKLKRCGQRHNVMITDIAQNIPSHLSESIPESIPVKIDNWLDNSKLRIFSSVHIWT